MELKAKREEEKFKELPNHEKYTMSFNRYMKNKTHKNISKEIYQSKIKQEQNYVEKFQKYILKEFTFSEQGKRKLEKVFTNIAADFQKVQNRSTSVDND